VVLVFLDKVMRRLLPLVALLKLSMIFPDQAPSRLALAMKASSVRRLKETVGRLEAGGPISDNEAAIQVLELVAALTNHDRCTRGHFERVKGYAYLISQELGLDEEDANKLQWTVTIT